MLEVRPTPTIAPTVTWLVDWGIFSMFARKRLNVAELKMTNTASRLISSFGIKPFPSVIATFLPRITAPIITKMPNMYNAVFFFISLPP